MTQTLSANVDLLDGMAFRAITASGHELTMDAAPEVGGNDTGAGRWSCCLPVWAAARAWT